MATEITIAMIGFLTTVVSSLITFVLTRRKYNLELDSKKIQNMNDMFDYHVKVYNETVKVLNQRIDMLQKDNDSQRQQINSLNMRMSNLMGIICMDASCKLRKVSFSPDQRFDDR